MILSLSLLSHLKKKNTKEDSVSRANFLLLYTHQYCERKYSLEVLFLFARFLGKKLQFLFMVPDSPNLNWHL